MRYSTRPQGQLVEGETFQEVIRDGKPESWEGAMEGWVEGWRWVVPA
jgi:hypothetical protein